MNFLWMFFKNQLNNLNNLTKEGYYKWNIYSNTLKNISFLKTFQRYS